VKKKEETALVEAFEAGSKDQVRDLARVHTRAAINTLVRLMKAPKTPSGVKRQCAADILAQGWGRPDARGGNENVQQKGLVINILKLSTGVVESMTHNSTEMAEVMDAVEVANLIEAHTEKPQ
jgi:hypothetical protein